MVNVVKILKIFKKTLAESEISVTFAPAIRTKDGSESVEEVLRKVF